MDTKEEALRHRAVTIDEIVEIQKAHLDFTADLDLMAMRNLRLVLGAIEETREHNAHVYRSSLGLAEQQDMLALMIKADGAACDMYCANARLLAAVALVTRFQHWVGKMAKAAKISAARKMKSDPSLLILQLEALNKTFGAAPVPIQFFDELEEVRNSVIHADSKAEWESQPGRWRKVANRYRNARGETELNDAQLAEAMNKMVEQIRWYEPRVDPTKPTRIQGLMDKIRAYGVSSRK